MLERHDTTLLGQALEVVWKRAALPTAEETERRRDQAEVEHAAAKQTLAVTIRRPPDGIVKLLLATAVAVAIVAAGVGLGWYSSRNQEPPSTTTRDPGSSETTDTIETTDYDKFKTRSVSLLGRAWEVTAGHHFKSESDLAWTRAWCYTRLLVDGLAIEISLAERDSPATSPHAPIANAATLRKASLTEAEAVALATKCSWLDRGDFQVTELTGPAGKPNPFQQKPDVSINGETLTYVGGIGPDFLGLIKMQEFYQLRINSGGGLVDQALEAGTWLRQTNKAVEVTGDCLSACVYVLAGGSRRTAEEDARIGGHRFSSREQEPERSKEEIEQRAQELSAKIVDYLQRMGIDNALYSFIAKVPSDSMEYIAHDQLKSWKLLSEEKDELYRTTINDLSIRKNADPNSDKIGEIPRDTNNLNVSKCHWPPGLVPPYEWCYVTYDGKSGWVNKKYLEKQL